jgi:hypothetical protein
MCDTDFLIEIVKPGVRQVCEILLEMKLKSLILSLDCKCFPRSWNPRRYEAYCPDFFYDDRPEWKKDFRDGIEKVLQPSTELRALPHVEVDGVPENYGDYLKKPIQSPGPNPLLLMGRRLAALFPGDKSVREEIQDAVEQGNLGKFEALREEKLENLRINLDHEYDDDPSSDTFADTPSVHNSYLSKPVTIY